MRGRLSRAIVADAALEAARVDGIERLSLRHVATLLGVAPTALYGHVADRDDLYRAIAQTAYAQLATVMAEASRQELEPVERVRSIVRAYYTFGSDDSIRFRIMTRFRPQLTAGWSDDQIKTGKIAYDIVVDAVERAVAAGAFRRIDPDLAALAILATARGTTTFAMRGTSADAGDDESVAFAVLDTVIDAFAVE